MSALPAAPSGLRHFATVALAALMLCLVAVLNGQPFFYPDTPSYVRGADMGFTKLLGPRFATDWSPQAAATRQAQAEPGEPAAAAAKRFTSIEDKIVMAGRSVYYGALLYLGYVSSDLWGVVAVQALAAAYLLHLLMVRLWSLGAPAYLGTVAALTVLTPLGAFVGLLLPDVFAPLIILAVGTMTLYWTRLRRADRAALAVLTVSGLVSHPSHLALAVAFVAVLAAARWLLRAARPLSVAGLGLAGACLLAGFVAEWVFFKAVTVTVGQPPLRMPHPMARLIDMGPGTAFLQATCPGSGYAACAYLDNYPTPWVDFIFSVDPDKGAFALADAATKRRLSGEQARFFLDVVRFDPLGVARGLGADLLRQLVMFRVDTLEYRSETPRFATRLPAETFETLLRSRAAEPGSGWDRRLTLATTATVIASLVIAVALAAGRRRPAARDGAAGDEFQRFAVVLVVGMACNALVCATLASPFDRFQARVIWLLPFLALAALALARARSARQQQPGSALRAAEVLSAKT